MEAIQKVLTLISKALKGELSLDELYQTWPESLAKNKLYETIYDDIESAVEHYPSKVYSIFGKDDSIKYFQNSYEHKALLADQKIINLILAEKCDMSKLLEMRNKLLAK